MIALAAVHSDGDAKFAMRGVGQFGKTTQDASFNIKAFLSYYYTQGGYFAVGIEKSWGGDQIMSGGALGALFGPILALKDGYLAGHVEAVFVVTPPRVLRGHARLRAGRQFQGRLYRSTASQ